MDIRGLRFAAADSAATVVGDPRRLAHTVEWQPWRDQVDRTRPVDAHPTLALLGSGAASEFGERFADLGYTASDVSDARYVVYLAAAASTGQSHFDGAARMTAEVADLVRRLAQRDSEHPVTLWIITRGVRDGGSDEALCESALWGLAGVIGAEQPQLWGGLVDLPPDDDVGAHASALAALLPNVAKCVLALGDGEFLAPTVVPVTGDPPREPVRCRADAAYLVTGGMGALGLLTAAWLADRGARRLVLAGRTPLPPRRDWNSADLTADARNKIAAIRMLERRGVSVDAVAIDVGSREAVHAFLAKRDAEGAPPIGGVVHAAGITDSQLLTDLSDDRLRRTMWPKIAGAQIIQEAFPPDSVDFLYLTASAGGIFGVPGQAAYAAANAYLDCVARARQSRGGHTLSLDWVAWRGIGFGKDAQVVEQELARLGSRPVSPEEAFAAWEYVGCFDVAQVVMAPLPSDEAERAGEEVAAPVIRAWADMPADDVVTELEIELRTILAHELLMPETELELNRPFAELGLNSVMAMSVRRQAEQLIGIELSATMLWNHPTIASLAVFLSKSVANQHEPEPESDLLPESDGNVLDALFDSVESAAAGSGRGGR
jgi:phthiocerol/phenolphthiocerol synthesis type-I polyketide synthase A